jgi:hypothetical protein
LIPIVVGGREMMLLGRHELRVWLSAELRTNLASSVDKEIEKLEADRFRTPFCSNPTPFQRQCYEFHDRVLRDAAVAPVRSSGPYITLR